MKHGSTVWLVPNVFLCSGSAGGSTGDGEEEMSQKRLSKIKRADQYVCVYISYIMDRCNFYIN